MLILKENELMHGFDFGRFTVLRGSSGFYSYGIYEHVKGWPAFNLTNTRIAFKLRKDMYVLSYILLSNFAQINLTFW